MPMIPPPRNNLQTCLFEDSPEVILRLFLSPNAKISSLILVYTSRRSRLCSSLTIHKLVARTLNNIARGRLEHFLLSEL